MIVSPYSYHRLRITLLGCLMFCSLLTLRAQVVSTNYYADAQLTKEVPREKALYVQTVTRGLKGAVTTDVRNTKQHTLVSSETFRDDEPIGLWTYTSGSTTTELDYNFVLEYDDLACGDSIPGVGDPLVDHPTQQYQAPVTTSGLPLSACIAKALFYPVYAKKNGIAGTVVLRFTLTEQGTIDNLVVVEGSFIQLDKEAARVIRSLTFATPAQQFGLAKKICITVPVRFRLF